MITAYQDWIVGKALPFWAEAGFDAARARFRERLDWQGRSLDVPHRAMVQARQIYVFAHAALNGWFAEGGRLAEAAMASLLRDFCSRSGGRACFAFSIGGDGRVASPVRDLYAHAFVLFALGWLYRLNGDRRLLLLADEIVAFIDGEFADAENGGLFDELPASGRGKRQNPHMHLFEAYLALDEAAPGRCYLERAAPLAGLFRERLFRPEPGLLLEHFSEEWADHPDPARRGVCEPGHHFEWVWLLHRHQQRSGEDHGPWMAGLYEAARRYGVSADGLVFDELALDMSVTRRSHRIWPHAEALKAAVVRHADGDPLAAQFASMMARILMDHFLDRPIAGGWVDHLSATRRPLVDHMPASTLYHLFLAAAEAARGFAA